MMARSAPAPIIDGVSTMSKLASFLRQARDITGQISFHSSLHNAATQLVRSSDPASGAGVADMVQALDCDEPKLCARLSVNAFILIFAVLRSSKSSWPKHRGLCLLAESLTDSDRHRPPTQTSSSSLDGRALLSRKARIGADVLRSSVKHFCNRAAKDGDRRWMGLLALELLKDCKENVCLLVGQSEEFQEKLGSTVIDEQNELLRYIAGSIIRQLVRNGVSVGSFWPTGVDIVAHTAFLEPQVQSPQWLEMFEGYLDSLDSQTEYHNEKFAPFSHLLRLGQDTYASRSPRSPSVLVTIHGLLSIVVLEYGAKSGDDRAAQYIDVPFEKITGVDITRSIVDTSAASVESQMRFMAHIQLADSEDYTVYVNARAQHRPFVDLAFDDKDIADYLKTLIQTRQSQTKSVRGGHCTVLNGLRSTTDGMSLAVEHSLPKQLKSKETQNLIATSVHAHEILEGHLYQDNSNVLNPGLASDTLCNKPKHMPQATRVSLAGSPMLASVGEAEAQFGIMIEAAEAMVTSNSNCLSLSQWNDGADTIETALEFLDHIPDSNTMNNATTELQEEHDSHDRPAVNMPRDTKRVQKEPGIAVIGTAKPATVTGRSRLVSAHPNVPTALQRSSLSKVSRRLLGRDGELINPWEIGNREPDRSSSTTALPKPRPLERDNAPASPSKNSKGGTFHEMTPVKNVYDLPSSPPRVSKAQPARKGRNNQAKSSTTKTHKSAPSYEQSKKKSNHSSKSKTKAGTAKLSKTSSLSTIVKNIDHTGEDEILEGDKAQEESIDLRSATAPLQIKSNSQATKNGKISHLSILSATSSKPAIAVKAPPTSKARIRDPTPTPAILKHGKARRTAAINAKQRIQGLFTKVDQEAGQLINKHPKPLGASDLDDNGQYGKNAARVSLEDEEEVQSKKHHSHTHHKDINVVGTTEVVQSHSDSSSRQLNEMETTARIDEDADTVQPVLAAHEKPKSADESRRHGRSDSRLKVVSDIRLETPFTPQAELVSANEPVDLVASGLIASRPQSTKSDCGKKGSEMETEANLHNQTVNSKEAPMPEAPCQFNPVEGIVAIPVAKMLPLATKSNVFTPQRVSLPLSQNRFQPADSISEIQKDKAAMPHSKKEPMRANMNASIVDNVYGDMSHIIHISSEEEPSSGNERQSSEEVVSNVLHQKSYAHKKRKSDDVVEDSIKRVKISTSKPTRGTGTAENADIFLTDDYTQRKTTIIGFSMEGPRNQGVLSSNKTKRPVLPQKVNNIVHNTPSLSTKRKRAEVQETTKPTSPKRVARAPADKRRRTVKVVPPTREVDQPVYTRMNSPCLQSVSQKLSSQGTRVHDNGSPIATADQVRRVTNVSMDGLLRRLTDDWEVDLADEHREEEINADSLSESLWRTEMELPPMRPDSFLEESAPGRKHYVKRTSSNMKLQPSSPTAPSRMLEDMAAHKVRSDGKFVNLHTATVVQTTIPKDPFVAKGQNPQSSFMQMLRASVQTDEDNRVQTEKKAGSASQLFADFASHHVDPDRTLVENKFLRHPQQPSSSPGDSSSPPRSGGKRRPLASGSDEGEKREQLADVWRNALRQHHRGTLGSLYDMSNRLVRHLLDKESAIEDAVVDYDTGGARLVEALSEAQRESRGDSGVKINNAKQTLTKSFGTLEAHLSNKLKETKSQRVKDLQKTGLEEQQKIRSHLESAMITWEQ